MDTAEINRIKKTSQTNRPTRSDWLSHLCKRKLEDGRPRNRANTRVIQPSILKEIERMNSKRIDKLEKLVQYQKWGFIVLMSLFLFTSTPGITEITQRVKQILLPKEILTGSFSGNYSQKTIGDVPESPLRVTPAKKIAQAAGDILTVSQINVVDAIAPIIHKKR